MSIEEENFKKLLRIVPNLKDLREAAILVATGFMDLGVEPLEIDRDKRRISLIHHRRHWSGTIVPDPEMELEVHFAAQTVRALTFRDSIMLQRTDGNPALQIELNRFLSRWLSNLIAQGHKLSEGATQSADSHSVHEIAATLKPK